MYYYKLRNVPVVGWVCGITSTPALLGNRLSYYRTCSARVPVCAYMRAETWISVQIPLFCFAFVLDFKVSVPNPGIRFHSKYLLLFTICQIPDLTVFAKFPT